MAWWTRTLAAVHFALLLLVAHGARLYADAGADDLAVEEAALALLATDASRAQQEEDMRAFVGIASVAAESKYDRETRATAEWLREFLSARLGMEDAALYESGYRHPVVVASTSDDASKPAIVIYGASVRRRRRRRGAVAGGATPPLRVP